MQKRIVATLIVLLSSFPAAAQQFILDFGDSLLSAENPRLEIYSAICREDQIQFRFVHSPQLPMVVTVGNQFVLRDEKNRFVYKLIEIKSDCSIVFEKRSSRSF